MITEYRVGRYRVPKFIYDIAFWAVYVKRIWYWNSHMSVSSRKKGGDATA